MKKKKISAGAALVLAVLFLLFGRGADEGAAGQIDPAAEAVVRQVVEQVMDEAAEAVEEAAEPMEAAESAEVSELVEAVEPEEVSEPVEAVEPEEVSEPVEAVEPEEVSEPVESAEPAEKTTPSELATESERVQETSPDDRLDLNGSYDSKEEVALYIYQYGELPPNYISKKQAQELGWEGGSVEQVAPGKCIGGSRFGNYEGLLPEKKGRFYTECDIDTLGRKSRGAKRIVFSNDGLIYYTDDHYESFELLYGEE